MLGYIAEFVSAEGKKVSVMVTIVQIRFRVQMGKVIRSLADPCSWVCVGIPPGSVLIQRVRCAVSLTLARHKPNSNPASTSAPQPHPWMQLRVDVGSALVNVSAMVYQAPSVKNRARARPSVHQAIHGRAEEPRDQG